MNGKQYKKADKTPEALRAAIDGIELLSLRNQPGAPMWTADIYEYVEKKYRNFLYLCGLTGEIIVPTHDVDLFWHPHILDTVKYRADCESAFGFYLDHFPYLGLQGDEKEFEAAFTKSKQLYEAQFGEPYEIFEAVELTPGLREKIKIDPHGRSCG